MFRSWWTWPTRSRRFVQYRSQSSSLLQHFTAQFDHKVALVIVVLTPPVPRFGTGGRNRVTPSTHVPLPKSTIHFRYRGIKVVPETLVVCNSIARHHKHLQQLLLLGAEIDPPLVVGMQHSSQLEQS